MKYKILELTDFGIQTYVRDLFTNIDTDTDTDKDTDIDTDIEADTDTDIYIEINTAKNRQ